jgi:hypothetical protein
MTVLDLGAPIHPGIGAAGVAIGQSADELPAPLSRVQLRDGVRLDYACVSVWLKDARVVQVGVRQGYSGSVRYCIGIGSTVGEVGQLLGPVHEDFEDDLVVLGVPGLCFETSIWRGERLEDNRDAPITGIFVFREAGERPVAVAEEVRDD